MGKQRSHINAKHGGGRGQVQFVERHKRPDRLRPQAAASGTGTVTASSTITDNLYKNGSTQATLTFNLPASPTDGQICKVSFNDIITALTVSGNGESINGTLPTSAAVGSSYEFKFYQAIPAWIRKY